MPKTAKRRIDWMPSRWAEEVIETLQRKRPELSLQAAIDLLVITGASALEHPPWTPPALFGSNRKRWRKPSRVSTDGT